MKLSVRILGIQYEINLLDKNDFNKVLNDHNLNKNSAAGISFTSTKEIFLSNEFDTYTINQTLSHELWHCFFHEAGLEKYECDETLIAALSKLSHNHNDIYKKIKKEK